MKKVFTEILSLLLAACLLCAGFTACSDPVPPSSGTEPGVETPGGENPGGTQNPGGENPAKKEKLSVPVVVIGQDGVAVWNAIEYAMYYIYVIDGGGEQITTECSAQLSDGQSLSVKAVSGEADYSDSDFSAPLTYHKGEVPDPGHDHVDVNADGTCDKCGESVLAELSFYAVNDLHGKFIDTSTQPGLDEFTTYLKDLYADDAREEILLSSGDMWQGTVESSSNRGQLMTEWMNEVGFVSMTLGNHEYDWGADVLLPNSELAEFPFLAINVTDHGAPAAYCRPSVVVEKGGVKIGIIGAIGDCLGSISGEFSDGLSFATGDRLTALVKDEATRLRTEEGCDFIVYSIHDGGSNFSSSGINSVSNADLSYYDTALSDGFVDLVFEGHTHKQYILKDEYGVFHLQGGGENRAVSRADVSFNTVTGDFEVEPKMIQSGVYGRESIADDPVVGEIYEKYFPDEDPYTTVLGRNVSRRDEDAICNRVARLYYEKGVETWGKEYKIVLAGGYLNTRSPYNLSAGNVTYADLFSLLPFDNAIVLGKIKGSDLKKRFLNSSSYYIYATIDASEVSDGQQYYIIVDSYTSTYRWNNITEVDRLAGNVYARDLLADYIRSGEWSR